MTRDAWFWIEKLRLERHPEGGFFRETYRSGEKIPASALPRCFEGPRSFSTAIYFLLSGNDFSAFHRIKSDELWHFYAGSPLAIHIIDQIGEHHQLMLGSDPDRGELFQTFVKGGDWFGACLVQPDSFALVGCTVAPGFDFRDFEMADSELMIKKYPQHAEIIRKLTRHATSDGKKVFFDP